jgi:SAM-dependent methyltransferase
VETQSAPLIEFDFDAVFDVDDYMYFYSDMITDEGTERQIAFLVKELGLDAPVKILDLACGFGRHANRLAALGHAVTGIDLTPGFLELARRDALARDVQVNYNQGDMRRIEYQDVFDRVLLMFTAFGYFEDMENLLVLSNIARALKPGGLLLFDIMNRDTFLKGFWPDHVTEKEGNLMIDRHIFDSLTGRLYNRRIVIRDGIRRDKPFFIRMYNASEIQTLVHQAGMQIINICGDWDAKPLTIESRRMIIIAQKV